MSNEMTLVPMEAKQITNKKLVEHMATIMGTVLSTEQNGRRVAYVLAEINADKSYKDDFNTCAQFATSLLGIGKSQAAAVIKVGSWFIKDGKNYETVLKHDMKDYTVTQLQTLLPLKSVDTAIDLANNGIINPFMTVKELKEIVNQYKPKKELKEGKEEATDETSDKSETQTKAVTIDIQATLELGTAEGKYFINGCEVEEARYKYVMDFIGSLGME